MINLLFWPYKITEAFIRVRSTITGEPVSKQRPKFAWTKGGRAYTPIQTKAAEERLAWEIKAGHSGLICDADSAFAVRALFFCRTFQRRDIDNMVKLVLDACTGIVWQDDHQVLDLHVKVERGVNENRTELLIHTLGITPRTRTACPACQREFMTYPSALQTTKHGRKYCSKTCAALGKRTGLMQQCAQCGKDIYRLGCRAKPPQSQGKRYHFFCSQECRHLWSTEELTCANCQKNFRRPRSLTHAGRTYCSMICRNAFWRSQRREAASGMCFDCGKPTTKKLYVRCRGCHLNWRRSTNGAVETDAMGDTSAQVGTRPSKPAALRRG